MDLEFKDFIVHLDEFLKAVTGIVISITFLWKRKKIGKDNNKNNGGPQNMKKIGYLSIFFIAGVFSGVTIPNVISVPLNEELTTAAWEAYKENKFEKAIKAAEKSIRKFEATAFGEQRRMKKKSAPEPSVGKVPEEEKQAIFKQGPLNDVAASWWIKAEYLYELQKEEEADKAYCEVAKLTYARVFDPENDTFWSPSLDARDKISFRKIECK